MKNDNILYYIYDINKLRNGLMSDQKIADNLNKIDQESLKHAWSSQAFLESFENLEDNLQDNLQNHSSNNLTYHYFCAIENNNSNKLLFSIIGYIGFYEVSNQCYITNIAVLKRFRNQGIGTKLLSSTIDFAKKNFFEFISLEVRVSNSNAINLYEKLNFKQTGLRKNFYFEPTEDALIMSLFLK